MRYINVRFTYLLTVTTLPRLQCMTDVSTRVKQTKYSHY